MLNLNEEVDYKCPCCTYVYVHKIGTPLPTKEDLECPCCWETVYCAKVESK